MPCSHLPPPNAPDPLQVDDRWLTETVHALARGVAADLAFDRLPILADALEDAGCDNLSLLHHLRSDETHRVECWALRRLLRTMLLLPGGVPMAFAYCPPGAFLMGSPETEAGRSEDELQHEVRLTRGFYAGVHPVTQEQWRTLMGTDPSSHQGDMLPVESVSWDDAVEFCDKLRELTGTPVRLPTEAEWEYACRGGTTTPFYWGTKFNGRQANCNGRFPYGTEAVGPNLEETSAVGKYAAEYPHPWGLADVIGNVWEWCADWYDAGFYARSPADDPRLRDGERKLNRVLRGGSWLYDAARCRAAYRHYYESKDHSFNMGFRVVFTA